MTLDPTRYVLEDGGLLLYYESWLSPAEARDVFEELRRETPWKSESIRIAGKLIPVPRLTAWFGDPEAVYTYSGVRNEPSPWTPRLADLRERASAAASASLNSVLLNYYRNGRDSMGWHADDERELGRNPVIASLSLGAPRRFLLRHEKKRGKSVSLVLGHGSLLVMAGATQHHYRHAVPKEDDSGERINLTFRRVFG
ncbi:MAG TPA: alpha-ketoglutarate-dependent dioxygenase AlkB [Polyangiaceae bacterium]|nr:alpha-ketoglutarate-dependent dioxygenase AlkB [Polyangiaceae bacterium]